MKNFKLEEKIKKDVPLKEYTTFKIGGPASYFLKVESVEELIKAIKKAKDQNLPFFILGAGSNLLVSDEGFDGLVLKINLDKLELKKKGVFVQAGVKVKDLIDFCIQKNLRTSQWATGIPASVGGLIRNNASSFSGSVAEMVKEVNFLDSENFEVKKMSKEECNFSYKQSIFKENPNLVILSALLEKNKAEKEDIKEKIEAHKRYRKENHPMDFPSAGCVFKNLETKIKDEKILKRFPKIKEFNKKGLISSSYLLDKAGLKGKQFGDAMFSKKHANFIINKGDAKAEDVLSLINLAKEKVKQKFGVNLKEEVEYLK